MEGKMSKPKDIPQPQHLPKPQPGPTPLSDRDLPPVSATPPTPPVKPPKKK
jgi:hypothetical protein